MMRPGTTAAGEPVARPLTGRRSHRHRTITPIEQDHTVTLRLPTTVAAVLAELRSGNPRDYLALSDLMEFDHPITVTDDGRVTDGPANLYAPNLYDDDLDSDSWELLNGYSGQDRYAGPIMHPSEFIGGGMARDILDTPGTYVAVAAYYSAEFTHAACGAGSVQCRNCDAYIAPDESGDWVTEETDDTEAGEPCPENESGAHDPEDQEPDGWAVARLITD
jgi:hypothetical protein